MVRSPSMFELPEEYDGGGDHTASKSHLRILPSMVSQDVSINSYNEIVTINEEGHQYIDINRLIYPTRYYEKEERHQKEKLSWYLPDFTFIICNLLSVGLSTYFILIGASVLQWRASMSMFSLPNCKEILDQKKEQQKLEEFYYLPCMKFMKTNEFKDKFDYKQINTIPILRTKLSNPDFFAIWLIVMASFNIINVFVGVHGCMRAYKPVLIQHIIADGVIVVGKLAITVTAAVASVCDQEDLKMVRWLLRHYVRWYGTSAHLPEARSDKEKEVGSQLDSLQIGLGCCGVDNWADYLSYGYPHWDRPMESTQLDGGSSVIPFSCCQRWWIRNIYCSYGMHLLAHPTANEEQSNLFHERIVQDGCLLKLQELCGNISNLMGLYGCVAACIHLILILFEAFAAFTLIRNINKMLQEQKQMMKKKEIMSEEHGDNSGSDHDFSTSDRLGIAGRDGGDQWSKIPPPTEDEIATIKDRSNFNKFIAALKYGKVGRWMQDARDVVTEGIEAKEREPQTAEEKKQREKELLHGKSKKEGHDDSHHHTHHSKKKTKTDVRPPPQTGAREDKTDKTDKTKEVADTSAPPPTTNEKVLPEGKHNSLGSVGKEKDKATHDPKVGEKKKSVSKIILPKKIVSHTGSARKSLARPPSDEGISTTPSTIRRSLGAKGRALNVPTPGESTDASMEDLPLPKKKKIKKKKPEPADEALAPEDSEAEVSAEKKKKKKKKRKSTASTTDDFAEVYDGTKKKKKRKSTGQAPTTEDSADADETKEKKKKKKKKTPKSSDQILTTDDSADAEQTKERKKKKSEVQVPATDESAETDEAKQKKIERKRSTKVQIEVEDEEEEPTKRRKKKKRKSSLKDRSPWWGYFGGLQ